MNLPLRAVIADDSALYRALLTRALGKIGGVDVVAQASNGAEAIDCVRKLAPDFLTLDLNMPKLDGLGTLRAIREARLTCEVIMVSSVTRQGAMATLEALQLGAVDFITKPDKDDSQVNAGALEAALRRQLSAIRLRRNRIAHAPSASSHAQIPSAKGHLPVSIPEAATIRLVPEVIAIGVSTGGPAALPVLISALPESLRVPVLIVQHMPPIFTASLADSLNNKCALRVQEGHDGQLVAANNVYIAPGGCHMKVKRAFDQSLRLSICDDPPENHCRPSVDVLFRSVGEQYGGRVIAAILTGMGNDGVAGLRVLKQLGARTIAQDEATCTVFGMPQEAIRAGVVDSVLPLNRIAEALVSAVSPNGK
jgi:two-component system, chemotaxis family, protein-glutamate methylesterase/glutaminase